ncbi:TetR/AcrR family transcriptional regulator [Luteipulveratus mongoliensis]|uniref:TetR family transcriptional regulator n=1 Tax=Luteipulveratus mongoliensis TaxID=571913 RepID=A0A0K1JP12_9MICO|nr:TetR/AcrR family transcriptional regulator [Luteipulveratus mongoliensis]AKU18459.1 TetR family transcriptional regulator [Luteipulveratus mongoliensis]
MAVARTPRHRWIEEGLRALAAGGPDAVRIEPLAQALGVSKGGFYGYFANRNALLEEMLAHWESEITDTLIERIDEGGGDAGDRLRRLYDFVSSSEAPTMGVTTDLAIRDWARRDPAVAELLRRVDNRRMDYLRELFGAICGDPDEAEARSRLVFASYIGERFMVADHGGSGPEGVAAATRRLLLAP